MYETPIVSVVSTFCCVWRIFLEKSASFLSFGKRQLNIIFTIWRKTYGRKKTDNYREHKHISPLDFSTLIYYIYYKVYIYINLPDIFLPEAVSNSVVHPAGPNSKGWSYLQSCRDKRTRVLSLSSKHFGLYIHIVRLQCIIRAFSSECLETPTLFVSAYEDSGKPWWSSGSAGSWEPVRKR